MWVEGLYGIDSVWSTKECVCCACDSSVLMTSAISCPLWSSMCQRVECAFTSLVRTECGMIVMYCMQCCMGMSAVL